MKYSINLFGYHTECQLSVEHGKLIVDISGEEQKALEAYLTRVLPRYGKDPTGSTLSEMINQAIEAEKQVSGHMSEPKIKLPYEFMPEIKEKLIEAANLQDMSATQLLIKLIEKKYQSVVIDQEG
ncbi:hypothetical protein NDK47_11075 [Brevibacillus ruminantium]|uniref:Uncharacterized protein n=1 Tax=Brevibacillus ruminantium TaxID=2950604 RepID=A0ABY4WKV0_9BACL|nr:hypothetical protein [Brevibacillus ruminantium]USG67776.1 hypothetical protein NDK47_11075 [Brevibacillus ruminantium]